MTTRRRLARAMGTALAVGAWALPAAAQEFRADGGSGGGRRTGPMIGIEFFSDERELVVDAYKQGGLAGPGTPPPGYSSYDEEVVEHRVQYGGRHHGLRLHVQWLNDGPVSTRIGAWVGPCWAELTEQVFPGDFTYGLSQRARNAIESKTGFGGGVFGEVRGSVPGGPFFWGLGLDSTIAQVALDNGLYLGLPLDGEYLFAIATVQARLGFTPRGQGVSPFVGMGFSYYYGDASLESVAGSTFLSVDTTYSDRAYARILLGLDLGTSPEWSGRIVFAIWKPDADMAISVSAMIRV